MLLATANQNQLISVSNKTNTHTSLIALLTSDELAPAAKLVKSEIKWLSVKKIK